MTSSYAPLASLWRPQDKTAQLAYSLGLVAFGFCLMTAAAKIGAVQFLFVPMSMQTVVVFGLAMTVGWRLATATLVAWAASVGMGIPLSSGNPYFTYGFIIGFIPAAMIVGWITERFCGNGLLRNVAVSVAAMLLASVVLYAIGLPWLKGAVNAMASSAAWMESYNTWSGTIAAGMAPFVIGDLIKIALVAIGVPTVWQTLRK